MYSDIYYSRCVVFNRMTRTMSRPVSTKFTVVNSHLNARPLWQEVSRRLGEIVYERQFISAGCLCDAKIFRTIFLKFSLLSERRRKYSLILFFQRKYEARCMILTIYIFSTFSKLIFIHIRTFITTFLNFLILN